MWHKCQFLFDKCDCSNRYIPSSLRRKCTNCNSHSNSNLVFQILNFQYTLMYIRTYNCLCMCLGITFLWFTHTIFDHIFQDCLRWMETYCCSEDTHTHTYIPIRNSSYYFQIQAPLAINWPPNCQWSNGQTTRLRNKGRKRTKG